MKINKYFLCGLAFAGAGLLASCSDELETQPTNSVSGAQVFENAEHAEAAINGAYRFLYTAGWSSGWGTQNCGQTAIQLFADLMAEDHLMNEQGQGWFYEDYRLNVHGDYAGKAGRSYSVWNFYYTIISNLNYILANDGKLEGDPDLVNSLMGQAYAFRAFCYFYLIQLYQQTYVGHENAPGVPLYTEPTVAGTEGKPRGTVQEVYDQINADLTEAVNRLKGLKQSHISHIDYYVAKGFQARVFLVQHKYKEAAEAAEEALAKPGLSLVKIDALGGNNSVKTADVMWGLEISKDQTSGYAGFFSHMDADAKGMYGSKARQCISSGLYNLLSNTDERKMKWFRGKLDKDEQGNSKVSYCQLKFKMADYTTWTGDYLLMRAEEMVLIKAEAECHLKKFDLARNTIKQLGMLRDANYEAILSQRESSETYNSNTNASVRTLMEEILLQRRVELWGEAGRIFDLQRLALGYDRKYVGSNHSEIVQTKNTGVASPLFIFPLPQSEIDGNEHISSSDNNPIVR